MMLFALVAVLALAAFVGFATPAGLRARLQASLAEDPNSKGDRSSKDDRSLQPDAATAGYGLRDTAMMLELVASMLDAGAGIGRALELISRSAASKISQDLRPVVAALAMGADWDAAWRNPGRHQPEVARLKDALTFAALTGAPSASRHK